MKADFSISSLWTIYKVPNFCDKWNIAATNMNKNMNKFILTNAVSVLDDARCQHHKINKQTPMKKTMIKLLSALTLLLAILFGPANSATAASGNWNVDAAGNWSLATSWSSNPTVPGTAADDVVGLTFNLTGARTVTIDTTSRTVGTLNIGDPTTSFLGFRDVVNG